MQDGRTTLRGSRKQRAGRHRATTSGNHGLPTMPYHHESLGMREDEANALIARVRRSIAGGTTRAVRRVLTDLAPSYRVVALAIREPPFPELPDTVAVVRQSYQLPCAADGMMYQLAMCRAARDIGLEVDLCRRGEETARASAARGSPSRHGVVRQRHRAPIGSALGGGAPPRVCCRRRGACPTRTSSPQGSDKVARASLQVGLFGL